MSKDAEMINTNMKNNLTLKSEYCAALFLTSIISKNNYFIIMK